MMMGIRRAQSAIRIRRSNSKGIASRHYNDSTKKFVNSGRVEEAARAAAPRTAREADEMSEAEHAALLRGRPKTPPLRDPPDSTNFAIEDPMPDSRDPNRIDATQPAADDGASKP